MSKLTPGAGHRRSEHAVSARTVQTMRTHAHAHRIAVVAVPPVAAFDLSIPELVFGAAELDGRSRRSATAGRSRPCPPR
ncbi:hypothetical protein OG535_10570 [Kitasatospora sp. NBC_00085]|uniref:hypothetical protein n=1 Tax=unclassified Kitasatospora TaxID=2633591 RepID=UPI00324FCB63